MRLVSGLLLAAAAAILFLGCGSTEEASQPQAQVVSPTATGTPTPTAAVTPTPTAVPTDAPTAVPIGTPVLTPSPTVNPANWSSYADPILSLSLKYPPDLTVTDSGLSDVGLKQRVLSFRSQSDPNRARFSISMSDSEGLTLEEWLQFTACVPKTIEQGTVAGQRALFCTSDPALVPEAAALFEHAGTMYWLTSIFMTPSEFDSLINSIEL